MRMLRRQVRRASLVTTSASVRLARLLLSEPKLFETMFPLLDEIGQWLVSSVMQSAAQVRWHSMRRESQERGCSPVKSMEIVASCHQESYGTAAAGM
ncbi:hypothetical protein WK24_24225 [Burkholderia vietnamiensis]|nr:hypothetical protein WK24_24225 [Burkholderia vietnamiensis]KVS21266.1 hypothetical protein WK34_23150 [Burkholderia vietnamiensis]OQD23084.1 hypothetical protein UE98_15925 [Burkholderia cenocepacia]PRE01355.1 hypothetical protein C6P91_24345 [Burkholderia multivorans]